MSEELTEWVVDKSDTVPGPWRDEPDRVEWRSGGFPCLIVRARNHKALCGYVGVPPGHPWHGKAYDDADLGEIRVHGGLTFADTCYPQSPVCHVPRDGEPAEVWWLGFDCIHAWDYAPGYDRGNEGPSWVRGVYRDVEYVRGQVEQLAKQAFGAASTMKRVEG